MVKVAIEEWKSGRIITARDKKGKLLSWRKETDDYPLSRARDEFKRNNAFTNKYKRETEELTNVIERRDIAQTKIEVDKQGKVTLRKANLPKTATAGNWVSSDPKKRKTVQYFVRFTMKDGSQIVGRSPALGNPLAKTATEAKDRAWEAVFAQFSRSQGSSYDADEGARIMESGGDKAVYSIDEGWVSYVGK